MRILFVLPIAALWFAMPAFEAVQPDLFSTGSSFVNAWADFDSDGDLDLFVGFNGAPNRLYRNDHGAFADAALTAGVADARPARSAAWGDFDGDRDPDLLVGFAPAPGVPVLKLYRNDAGHFADITASLNVPSDTTAVRQPVWIDFDADGDLDLFVAFRDRPNVMFRNDRGRFTEIAQEIGLADPRKSVGAVWFDFDEDGDLDLYVANMDGDANGLFRNDHGRFTDVAAAAGIGWGGRKPRDTANGTVRPCVADVNNDGHLDLFAANYGKNGLFLNKGGGQFEEVSEAWGISIDSRYDSCAFADFDNDGSLDMYVNGTVTGAVSYRDYLFRNTGTAFEDVTPDNIRSLEADHGVQWADFDRDGDMDLALTGSQANGMHSLLRNMLPAAVAPRSLSVLVMKPGAEVRVFAAGTKRLLGTRIVDSGSGYNSQNAAPVHFGLAQTTPVDIEVVFPGNGKRKQTVMKKMNPRDWNGRSISIRFR